MKIGITTFQWSENYGAVLQAHALQSFLRERNHDVQIVDYRVAVPVSWLRKWLAKTPRGCFQKWEAVYKTHLFEQFRKKYLKRTAEVFRSAAELRRIADRFDLLITGSDQVWNPQWLEQVDGLCDLFFLSFAEPQTRRISYAASFGHAGTSTMKKEWVEIVGEKLKQMDAISVREPSGVSLVRDLCGRTGAVHVVDPTLLLERSHYEKIAGAADVRGKYLFSYMLHGLEQDADGVVAEIAGALNLKVVKCDAHKTELHQGFTLPSPSGWLRQIRDADFVVTNSFHGAVFCLLFNIPFVVLLIQGPTSPMNSRITELLTAVGLENRIAGSGGSPIPGLLDEPIDWNGVHRQIALMKTRAADFLNTQLFAVSKQQISNIQ